MMKAGVGPNVIPSEAEATLDIRALPDEDIPKFYEEMKRVIDDPAVKIVPLPATRPPSPASRLDTEMYRILEQVSRQDVPGRDGTADHVHRRKRQSAAPRERDPELRDRTFCDRRGQHQLRSAQRRGTTLEPSLYNFVEFTWNAVTAISVHK